MKTTDLTMKIDEYLPLRDVVFQTLRRAIITGEFAPGERLMEITLANQLGVSRTPVREAIRKLELEGLVVMIPRKGAQVAKITEANLRDVIDIRTALEELAVSLACERIDEESRTNMMHTYENFKKSLGEGTDLLDVVDKDEQFHDSIFYATRNKRLINIISGLREQFYRYRMAYVKDPEVRSTLLKEHEDLMNAIFNHDVEAAKASIRIHLGKQLNAILDAIKESEN